LSRQREMLQDTLREVTDMAQSYRAPGNPQELMAKQTEFARKSFEAALKNAGEVAELVKKSGAESVDILRTRIKEAMEEIRAGYEKK
ncbi:TIGR01841 family phasin, partial [Mesorhizobium sp. M7A.F.Ca.US.007.01.1.1]